LVGVLHPKESVADGAVSVLCAFGTSCGTRSVDDISEVLRVQGRCFERDRIGALRPARVEEKPVSPLLRQQSAEVRLGQQYRGCGVVEHEAEPLRRIVRVERNVGSAGFEDTEQGDDEFERPLDGNGDGGVGLDAKLLERCGESCGAAVEFLVGECVPLEADGLGVRSAVCLLLDEPVEEVVVGILDARVVPTLELAVFFVREQW
jgi:hypothetical protein